jgi:hypothetical protein
VGGTPDKVKSFFSDWQISGITLFSSGTPFSVIDGGCSCGVSSLDNAGVAAVTGPGAYVDLNPNERDYPVTPAENGAGGFGSATFGPLLGNPARFMAPQGLTYGDAGRNSLNNPSRLNFDISLAKTVKFKEERSLEFRVESFNTFNHTQFRVYDPTNPGNTGNNIITCFDASYVACTGTGSSVSEGVGNSSGSAASSFLRPVDAHRPRTIQLGVKFFF